MINFFGAGDDSISSPLIESSRLQIDAQFRPRNVTRMWRGNNRSIIVSEGTEDGSALIVPCMDDSVHGEK